MGQSMREIKRRIRSTENMRQITKAMKMVATANLRRAQIRAEKAHPYAEKMRDVIVSIAQGTKGAKHPMLESRPVRKTGYLVITSERGLAGGYNSNLLRMLQQILDKRHHSKDEYVIFAIGRKGRDFLRKRNYPVIDEITGIPDAPTYDDVQKIARKAVLFYSEEKYDQLYIVYNQFVNPMIQRPVDKQLLPLTSDNLEEKSKGAKMTYEYEPSQEELLAALLPRYAEALVFSALLDAKASEFAARMTAMSNATENATEMIDTFTLQLNRARQAAITQELAEIVGGASALNG